MRSAMVAFCHDRSTAKPYGSIPCPTGAFVLSDLSPILAHAVPMQNDPNGFQSLAWGVALTSEAGLRNRQGWPTCE